MLTTVYKSIFTKPLAVLLSFSLLTLSFGLKSETASVTLKAGSAVQLETVNTIQSDLVIPGQMIDFRVVADVMADGVVVIPAGSIAKGQVMRAEKAKGLGKAGFLEVHIKSVEAVDGTRVNLTGGNIYNEGEEKQTLAIVLGILICILFLTMKGKNAMIPAGYSVGGTVASNVTIQA